MDITINLIWILLSIILIVIVFVISRVYKDNLDNKKDIHFKNKDIEITSEAFKKIGEVKNGTPNEIILNLQNVENNKEIFDHDKRIEELELTLQVIQNGYGKLLSEHNILKNRFDYLTKAIGREN